MRPAEDAHLRVLQLLHQQPDLSQRQLAEKLGISLGKANYVLRALLDRGAIKAKNFRNSQNKLAYAYVLTPPGLREKGLTTRDFLRRKQIEFEQLENEIAELRREVDSGDAAKTKRDAVR